MELEIEKDDVAFISGIGCSGRMAAYVDFNTMHTTHGRAIPFATGIKMHKPHMKVIVVSGDGDALAIGGNHFIHAARRNIDINCILVNNGIYGMTGGQLAPTTAQEAVTHTTPYGNMDNFFDPVELAISAGATFAARGTVHGIIQTTNYIKKAIQHPGFSLVEIISQCPVQYGRLNNMGDPRDQLLKQKELSITLSRARDMSEEELKGRIVTGIFREDKEVEYSSAYRELVRNVQEEMAKNNA
jgi:2-oxoglutarate ferredoxin oxidoreductase subunit beta